MKQVSIVLAFYSQNVSGTGWLSSRALKSRTLGDSFIFPHINVVYCCLQKCVEVHQCSIIRQVKHKMHFKKFIKCPKGTVCLAWDEMLIHGDIEAVNLVLLTTNGKEVWLPTLLVAKMLLQTAA